MSRFGSGARSKYALSDWYTSNEKIRSNADRLRVSSHTIRQDGRRLTNETDNHTRWTQHESSVKLGERIDDVHEWKESLERCLSQINTEIDVLQQEKNITEKALREKQIPLEAAIECLSLREERAGIDLVKDKPEGELHKEIQVIEGAKALLHQKVTEAFEQLCLLEEARHQIHCDLTDKNKALQIDNTCLEMNNSSASISLHSEPTKTVKGTVSPQTWESFSQYNKLRAETEMKAAGRLREAMFATCEKTANDVASQQRATGYAYRKRMQETDQAHNELQWQRKKTIEEIDDIKIDISALKEAIDAKQKPMMVAHSRLEARKSRPNVELCRDTPQYQLCNEVAEIEGSILALNEKHNLAVRAWQSLQNDLSTLCEDLAVKDQSLAIDNECMNIRSKGHKSKDQQATQNSNADKQKSPYTRDYGTVHQPLENDEHITNERSTTIRPKVDVVQENNKYIAAEEASKQNSFREHQQGIGITTYTSSYSSNATDYRSNDLMRSLNKHTLPIMTKAEKKVVIVD